MFNDVSFRYQENKDVLHNISFDAPAGSVTALVGSSGSGKTTIAGLVATFLNPISGLITLDGHDLSKINLSSYRKFLAVVLQDDFLYEGTIRENILFPRPNACLLYTSDAADERSSVDLGGRRIIKKKTNH